MATDLGAFRMLLVCTGNICRSPFAASLLRHNLGPAFEVSSAGTRALVDEAMTAEMQELALEAEAPDPDHRARQLEAGMIERADVVLTMTRRHRAEVAKLAPARIPIVFTLAEFGRLLENLADDGGFRLRGPVELSQLVSAVAARRAYAPAPADPADDDVVDPYRRSEEIYREAALQIAVAVDQLTGGLRRLAGVPA